jgi:hypothetical protein
VAHSSGIYKNMVISAITVNGSVGRNNLALQKSLLYVHELMKLLLEDVLCLMVMEKCQSYKVIDSRVAFNLFPR